MAVDYGIFIPNGVYLKLERFLKGKPKGVRMAAGILIGIPLLIADFLLGIAAPMFALFACSVATLPIAAFFSSRLTAVIFLFQLAMMGLNRYALWRGRKWMTGLWVGYMAIINIAFVSLSHGGSFPLLLGGLLIATSMANAAIDALIIFEKGPSRPLKYARTFTELALLALVYSL